VVMPHDDMSIFSMDRFLHLLERSWSCIFRNSELDVHLSKCVRLNFAEFEVTAPGPPFC
jgi:hypothetical protein